MKQLFLTLSFLISSQAFGLSLLQETKDITCSGQDINVMVDKKDRFIEISGLRYELVEFLDSAILTVFDDDYAHIQMLPKNKAVLTVGQFFRFRENQCEQVGAGKVCNNGLMILNWTPTTLSKGQTDLPVLHYGVYPNDGTFFLAHENQEGLALMDFGSEFAVLSGVSYSLDCQYK